MNGWDVLVAGYGARLHADRIAGQNAEIAEREGYMAQVAALISQGYSIDDAHREVQDFYSRQAGMQAQITAAQPPKHKPASRATNIFFYSSMAFLALMILVACLI